jgi:hypothetical protein
MAHTSLLQTLMRRRTPQDRRCTYLVVIERDRESADDLRDLASYLSTISVAGCEAIVVDGSPTPIFESNRAVLRWVSRHLAARPRHRNFTGGIDAVRTAVDVSSCDKIIVADENVRYQPDAIERVCNLLDQHEVVEPQDYFEPLPWWSGIEAGRMLVHRGVEPLPDHGATFGIRKSSIRGLRGVDIIAWSNGEDAVRRLASQGAEVFSACDVFVRRLPPPLDHWLLDRPRQAAGDFAMPVKTAFFFALLPIAIVLATFGGIRLAGGYAGAIAFASMVLAVRGRGGATTFFPLRACLCAPLWVFERSVSVYWALFRKLQGSSRIVTRPAVAEGGAGAKVASNL